MVIEAAALGARLRGSVRAGGRFDGPLGVAAAFEIAARARVPVAVISLADEEGARYDTPTFGSRALVERRDAMSAAARLIVAAEDLAAGTPEFVVTAARVLVSPNALTTVPAHVRLWIDARAPAPETVDAWRAGVSHAPQEEVSLEDAAVAATVVLRAVQELAA